MGRRGYTPMTPEEAKLTASQRAVNRNTPIMSRSQNPALGSLPPKEIKGKRQRKWWKRLVGAQEGLGFLRKTDSIVVWLACQSASNLEEATEALARSPNGVMLDDEVIIREHPAVAIQRKESGVLMNLLREMGLTPMSRSRMMTEMLQGRLLSKEDQQRADYFI